MKKTIEELTGQKIESVIYEKGTHVTVAITIIIADGREYEFWVDTDHPFDDKTSGLEMRDKDNNVIIDAYFEEL